MALRLKPLARQTIVITGASSGIGLATARMAAQQGAAVVLVARNAEALRTAVQGIRDAGGRAESCAADVADAKALAAAADLAIERFGGIDSWVNDAGTSVYGSLEETPVEEQRRLFETNYWGVVNGSLLALRHLKQRGGALVNLGSVLSDRAIPYQGTYSATKHAVKGFTDALRVELQSEGAPISVTLIKPAAVDTPFQDHARNRLGSAGVQVPPPTYDPRLVARAILFACTTPRRDLYIGSGGAVLSLLGALAPQGLDWAMRQGGRRVQTTSEATPPERRDNLFQPRQDGAERTAKPHRAHRTTSLLLEAQMHPGAALALGLAGLVAGATLAGRPAPHRRPHRR